MPKSIPNPKFFRYFLIVLCGFLLFHLFNPGVCTPPKKNKLLLQPIPADKYGMQNLYHISKDIYSGGEPHGESAFRKLADLGVKTMVSVDGATPQVKLAIKFGIRYVHIPIGYDGIPKTAGASLTRVIREAKGPIYFHCHHGKHRGPAATAVACIAAGVADDESAQTILTTVGTSKDYAGLWRDVAQFVPPKAGQVLPKLVEVAEVESLAAAMAKTDRQFDRLQLCQQAGWKTPPNHPDLVPVQEALQIRESFTEAARNLCEDYPQPFAVQMSESANLAEQLRQAISMDKSEVANQRFRQLKNACNRCHKKYRN